MFALKAVNAAVCGVEYNEFKKKELLHYQESDEKTICTLMVEHTVRLVHELLQHIYLCMTVCGQNMYTYCSLPNMKCVLEGIYVWILKE